MIDIIIIALNIWFILILIKPSKFLFFVKPEIKWKRLKAFGCYILLSIVLAAFMEPVSVDTTTASIKENKSIEETVTKDNPMKKLTLLEPNKKWVISEDNHTYDSLDPIGTYDIYMVHDTKNNNPHVETVFYNNTDKEEEMIWGLKIHKNDEDNRPDQFERIILPAKSICRFDTHCKREVTTYYDRLSSSLRKIGDTSFGKIITTYPYENKNFNPFSNKEPNNNNNTNSTNPRFDFKQNGNKVQIIEANYQKVNYMPRLTIRIKNDSKITQNIKVKVVVRNMNNNDILSDQTHRYTIPAHETISENVTPVFNMSLDELDYSKFEFSLFGEEKEDSGWSLF